MKRRTLTLVVAFALAVSAQTVLACPSCYGDPNSPEVEGMKWAILSLLGVTGTVLVGVSAFMYHLRKQASEFNRRHSDRLN